jgi:hypothetical protein
LRERTGLDDDAGAGQVAAELGWLALALAQAGAVIGVGRKHPRYGAYLDRLRNVQVSDHLVRVPGDPYPRGVAEAILVSVTDLTGEDADGLARRVLDVLSVLSPLGAEVAAPDADH